MKRWLRRLLVFSLLLVWLLGMLFPLLAVLLAAQKQIELGAEQGRHIRLFLVQEADQEGVGLSWSHPAVEITGGVTCHQTRVVYLMWQGEGENVTYCQCYAANGSLQDTYQGTCPPP